MKAELRPFELSDVERLAQLANNYEIARFLTNRFPHPYTVEHAKEFIELFQKDKPCQRFAIVVNDELIGGCGINLQEDIFVNNAELGYWIAKEYQGKGYMTDALKAITNYGFENFPVTRIFCRIYGNNPASMRVAEKAGFKLEAKFDKTLVKYGEVLDEYIYAKRR
jgi:ribosomal-protein-alanine N-acetyltransferase